METVALICEDSFLLMPSLLRVIGTIVHDTDFFFLKALKM